MGLFHAGLPDWLLTWVKTQGYQSAVETGTYLGNSAARLASTLGQCTTIELSEKLAADATTRFAGDSTVTVLQGSSGDLLPELCAGLDEPTFFWLDGHWSGGVTAGDGQPCPLRDELAALAKSDLAGQHVVAVDDARLVGFPHSLDPHMESWPRLVEVLGSLEAMGLRTYLVDDVIVGVPAEKASSFEDLHARKGIRQQAPMSLAWTWFDRVSNTSAIKALLRRNR
ncbi:MAG: hypothetical protein ACR2H3_02040 [Acidimicrobiales bacterium]